MAPRTRRGARQTPPARDARDDDAAVASFCAVTGADAESARHFLSAAAGDLDQAVALFLDGDGGSSAGHAAAAQDADIVRAPMAIQQHDVLVSDSGDEYAGFAGAVSRLAAQLHAEPFQPGPFQAEPFQAFADDSGAESPPPASAARRRRLADIFRVPAELVFPGTLADARREGTRRGAYVLLTVHDPGVFACQQMVRDVWRADVVRDLLASTGTLLLLLPAAGAEAARYAQYYPFGDGLPHWALLDPRTGRRVLSGPAERPSGAEPFAPEDTVAPIASYISSHPIATAVSESVQQAPSADAISSPRGLFLGQTPPGISPTLADTNPTPASAKQHAGQAPSGMSPAGAAAGPVSTSPRQPSGQAPGSPKAPAKGPAAYGPAPDEPPAGPDALTLQLRLPDGRRVRRRFLRTDAAPAVFAAAHALVPELAAFEVLFPAEGEMRALSATAASLHDLGLNMATLTLVPL